MKKKIYTLALVTSALLVGCSGKKSETPTTAVNENAVIEGTGHGYGGTMKVEVVTKGGKITDLKLVSQNETSVVIERAFPVIKDRIIKAQSPVVDSVSGATISSFAVKTAVADVLTQQGNKIEKITMSTQGPATKKSKLDTVHTQLVVVGGGPAGLSAAIQAKQNGVKDVILIEKLDILSGNGKFDMDFADLINSKAQKENGITDTVDDFANYLKEEKGAWDTEERILAQAQGSYILDEWLREQGTELNYNFDHRNYMSETNRYAGEQIQENMEKKAYELGVEIRTGTQGLDLIMEHGKAIGVKVKHKNDTYDITADAVIIATGGFSNNKELLKKYAPGTEVLVTSNQIGATGDFIPVFEKNNFAMDKMNITRIYPFIDSARRDLTGAGSGYLLVNKEGNSFIDESKAELELASAIKAQTDGKAYYIYDQKLYDQTYRLQKHNKLGYHTKAESLDELAEKLGIDAANLKETVAAYNNSIRKYFNDPCLGGTYINKDFNESGPFYGVQVESAIHMTKGGVVANEKAEILSTDGKVVEGLYAAGEVAASSQAYSAAVIFGRISGEEAANYITK